MTLRDPDLVGGTIAINAQTNGYYVSWVSLDPWVRHLISMHNLQAGVQVEHLELLLLHVLSSVIPGQVNAQGGCSVAWRKHGFGYGWRLCLLVAGWIPVSELPESKPDTADLSQEQEVRKLVQSITFNKKG